MKIINLRNTFVLTVNFNGRLLLVLISSSVSVQNDQAIKTNRDQLIVELWEIRPISSPSFG